MSTNTRHKTKYLPTRLVTLLLYSDLPGGSRRIENNLVVVHVPSRLIRQIMRTKADRFAETLDWTVSQIGATIIEYSRDWLIIHLPLPRPGAWSPKD